MRLKPIVTGIAAMAICASLFLLSYAPYLRFTEDSDHIFYRAPAAFRPVEWAIVYTPLRKPLMAWAELWGVFGRTQVQTFYLGQGISDPSNEIHFNFP